MSLSAAAKKTLIDHYEAFLRVGRLSFAEWDGLDLHDQAALLVAQKRIDIERAIMTAKAMEGPEAIASLMREVDGGTEHVRVVVTKAVHRWVAAKARELAS